MKKELKSGILSADGQPTVGGVNVIAVLKFNAKVGVGAWLEFKI